MGKEQEMAVPQIKVVEGLKDLDNRLQLTQEALLNNQEGLLLPPKCSRIHPECNYTLLVMIKRARRIQLKRKIKTRM
jgi:hypothetical protein